MNIITMGGTPQVNATVIVLLSVSITVRLAALGWSLVLLRRMRDWRVGMLSLLLGAMTLRQLLSLASLLYDGSASFPQLTIFGTEFPGLGISLLGLGLVFFMGRAFDERRRQEESLRQSEQRYRKIFDEGPLAMGMSDMQGRILDVNPMFCQLLNYEHKELIGRHILEITHPGDRGANEQHFQAMRAGHVPYYRYQKRFLRKDGTPVWVNMTVSLLRDDRGRPLYTLGMAEDITQHRAALARQQLMVNELDHRVKNNLATVVALAQQTLGRGGDIEEQRKTFIGRLHAMARAHEALANCRWQGVDLREVAALILRAHHAGDPTRVSLKGDALRLPPLAALPVSLVLHELATNAVKYGALSVPQGKVTLIWAADAAGDLEMQWIECGGPAPLPLPPRTGHGMGHELIEGLVGYQLRGNVRFDFTPQGLHCLMHIPLAATQDVSMEAADAHDVVELSDRLI